MDPIKNVCFMISPPASNPKYLSLQQDIKTPLFETGKDFDFLWAWKDLNLRLTGYEPATLTTELQAQSNFSVLTISELLFSTLADILLQCSRESLLKLYRNHELFYSWYL